MSNFIIPVGKELYMFDKKKYSGISKYIDEHLSHNCSSIQVPDGYNLATFAMFLHQGKLIGLNTIDAIVEQLFHENLLDAPSYFHALMEKLNYFLLTVPNKSKFFVGLLNLEPSLRKRITLHLLPCFLNDQLFTCNTSISATTEESKLLKEYVDKYTTLCKYQLHPSVKIYYQEEKKLFSTINGEIEGLHVTWSNNFTTIAFFSHGLKTGKEISLENGSKRSYFTYKEGKRDGKAEIWNQKGEIELISFYQDGLLHGLYEEYAHGVLKIRCFYALGSVCGSREEYIKKTDHVVLNEKKEYSYGKQINPPSTH